MSPLPLLGFVAWSGTGKTTLLERLIPLLGQRGLRLGVLKHTHHAFDIDQPGKDSHRLRQAGAVQVMAASGRATPSSGRRQRGAPSAALLARFDASALDLLLVEGFKHHHFPKVELYRAAIGRPLLFPDDPDIVALVSDTPPGHDPCPGSASTIWRPSPTLSAPGCPARGPPGPRPPSPLRPAAGGPAPIGRAGRCARLAQSGRGGHPAGAPGGWGHDSANCRIERAPGSAALPRRAGHGAPADRCAPMNRGNDAGQGECRPLAILTTLTRDKRTPLRLNAPLSRFDLLIYGRYRLVHGLRIALAFTLTFLLTRELKLPESTWPLITLVVVMGPISFWGNVLSRACNGWWAPSSAPPAGWWPSIWSSTPCP